MRGKITVKSVAALHATDGKDVTLSDTALPGFEVRARAGAKRLLGLVAQGKDPAAAKAAARAAPTVSELARRFLTEHAEAKRKPRTAKEYRRLIEHVILPALGKRRVADVTRQDVAKLHHDKRATPIEANRALAVLS